VNASIIAGSILINTQLYSSLCFFFSSETIIKFASNFPRKELLSFGTCFGRFTKTRKFRLHITALDFIAPYAKFKIWLKPNAEQQFLYGHNVVKSGLGRITENTPKYNGVIVYTMNDVPLVSLNFR
jgi:60S ribosome subunit biogenesis protein NIP7